ncbi:Peptidoglycan/LPS O-acetylase OafA/YrhL, contains acyltransferase and SGNH-hydrolase domains [Rhizobiales bacterium GAS113]|nr:Peptidoglycan/LPS O-acetylase OafA/YrhL, contains acyltransferase and SGNH-hydrolase domains [Rhizobiales bacterium GAS113]
MTYTLAAPDALPQADVIAKPRAASDIRIPALDGLRGLMTLFVLYSHFFVEVPHGIGVFYLGWVAVIVFFVLSGYLVGRLIIEKKSAGNFLPIFYLRRICRTFPTYFLCAALMLAIAECLRQETWMQGDAELPAWSYFAFMQNYFILARQTNGLHWLSPTWTLALEEQFYILAPFLFLFVPRRGWAPLLVVLCLAGVGLRAWGVLTGDISFAPLTLLPASADVLCVGMLLAVLVKLDVIPWKRWSLALRVAPIVGLLAVAATQQLDGGAIGPWFQILGTFFTALASALFILMLVKGAPEAARFNSRLLRFFGNISYSVYLTHLAVLGLMHGVILHSAPDTATPSQIFVTIAAIPVTIAIGWLLTRTLEQPITEWGRGFGWCRTASVQALALVCPGTTEAPQPAAAAVIPPAREQTT